MTLRSSSGRPDSAGNIFRYTLEQFRAILLFYAILMALLGPLSLLVQHWTDTGANGLGRSPNLLGWGLPLVMAVLLPLLIFSYVNNKQALDVFHAAPVRRGSLYLGRYLGGLVLVLLPLAVFGGCSVLVEQLCFDNGRQSLLWLLSVSASAFASYSVMVFVMINCGTMFESVVYYIVLNAGYPALIATLFSLLQRYTYGYLQVEDSLQTLLYSVSPYYLLTRCESWEFFRLPAMLIPLGMGAALALFGKFLYRRRKSESAGQSFAYRPLFFVGAVLTCLSAGMEFLLLSSGGEPMQLGWIILANLVGMVAYMILDTIRNRGFRRIRQTALTALCIMGGASALAAVTVFTGVFGYEDRIPALDRVEQVQVGMSAALSDNAIALFGGYRDITLEDPESIKLVLDFHQAMVAEKTPIREYQNGQNLQFSARDRSGARVLTLLDGYDRYAFDDGRYPQSDYGAGCSVQLTYRLKNGRVLARSYNNYPFVLTKPLYRLLQTAEYRAAADAEDLRALGEDGGILEINSYIFSGYTRLELDKTQTLRLRTAMAEDMSAHPADFLVAPKAQPLYQLSMRVWQPEEGYWNYFTGSCGVYDCDRSTLELLGQMDALPTVRTDAYNDTVVGYIPWEKRDMVMSYPERDAGIFYHAGRIALCTEYSRGGFEDPNTEQAQTCYEPSFVTLTSEQYQKLMTMVTQTRLTEEGGDAVVIGSVSYLVFPEYEEEVRGMLLSVPAYQPEY